MVTGGNIYQAVNGSGEIESFTRATLFGLSTDSKPTNFGNGSVFVEMNTGKLYFYNADGSAWVEWGA